MICKTITQAFADITAKLEDMHSISVEGHRRDNSLDMQQALAGQILKDVRAVDEILCKIILMVGENHG